jgi:DtxR family Mn-dependent transcriptional regulator
MTLDKLKTNGIIKEINSDNRRRLLELGFITGSHIRYILSGPFGSPIVYEIRGSYISLDITTAKGILLHNQ